MNIKNTLVGLVGSLVVAASAPAHAEIQLFSIGSSASILGLATDWHLVSFSTLSQTAPAVFRYELLAEETSGASTQTFSVNGKTVFGASATVGATAFSSGPIALSSFAFNSNVGGQHRVSTSPGNTPLLDHSGEYLIFQSKATPTTFALAYEDDYRVLSLTHGDFNDMAVRLSVAAVPEPETYAMMFAGLGAIGVIARRRRTV